MSLAENSPFFFVVAKNPSFDFVKMNVTFASGIPLPASSTILPETWASPRHAATLSLNESPARMRCASAGGAAATNTIAAMTDERTRILIRVKGYTEDRADPSRHGTCSGHFLDVCNSLTLRAPSRFWLRCRSQQTARESSRHQ